MLEQYRKEIYSLSEKTRSLEDLTSKINLNINTLGKAIILIGITCIINSLSIIAYITFNH